MNSQPTGTKTLLQEQQGAVTKPSTGKKNVLDVEDSDSDSKDPFLDLANKGIQKIELMEKFTFVSKLSLYNNLIEKIEGLDCMINLTWLDLSLNRIQKIEGLDALQKMEVLNLSNNSISLIENMDTLKNLSHFYISDNVITEMNSVFHLRSCKKLFKLCMTGNPVATDKDYTSFTAAVLPNLKFLDSLFINPEIRAEACVEFENFLEHIQASELKEKEEEIAKLEQQEEDRAQQSKKAFQEFFKENLNGASLFNSLLKDDPDVLKPHSLPEVAPLLQTYEEQMVELCDRLMEVGLAEHKERDKELDLFHSGQNDVKMYYRDETAKILAEFDEQQEKRTAGLRRMRDTDKIKVKVDGCHVAIEELGKSLMTLELQAFCNLEENIDLLDSSICEKFTETAHATFAQFQKLEEDYYHKLKEFDDTIEEIKSKMRKEKIPDDPPSLSISPNASEVNASGVTVSKNSHLDHLKKIDKQEIQLFVQINAWKHDLINEIRVGELHYHRARLYNINRYKDYLKEVLVAMQKYPL